MISGTVFVEALASERKLLVDFEGHRFVDDPVVSALRYSLEDALNQSQFAMVAFKLASPRIVSSSLLELLLELRHRGVGIQLVNPSPGVREILNITRLDTLFAIENGSP